MSRLVPSTSPGATSASARHATRSSRPNAATSALPGQQHGPGDGAAAVTHGRHLDPGHLAVAGLAPQLEARLVDEPEAVQPPRRQLAAVGVERQLAVERDAVPALDERARLPLAAEPERLQPGHG